MNDSSNKFDLEERSAKFGEEIVKFCTQIKTQSIIEPLLKQLIRSATSIGANYMEAVNASSKKDFRNKIFISKKEANETKHWLRMLSSALPDRKETLRVFWQEAHEFVLIFGKITSSCDNKNKN